VKTNISRLGRVALKKFAENAGANGVKAEKSFTSPPHSVVSQQGVLKPCHLGLTHRNT